MLNVLQKRVGNEVSVNICDTLDRETFLPNIYEEVTSMLMSTPVIFHAPQ